jgi:hypothetical protein
MIMNDADVILIEKYLDNELTEEELKVFKDKLDKDPEFKSEVNLQSRIHISLQAVSRISLKTMAENPGLRNFISVRRDNEISEKKQGSKVFLKIAAVVIPLIGLGGLIFPFVYEKPTPENLYNHYFTTPPSGSLNKGSTGETTADYSALMNKIDTAVKNQLDSLSLQNDEQKYYFAIQCMEKNKFREAAWVLNQIYNSRTNPYRQESEWYLVLCYLRINDIPEAINMLKHFDRNNSPVYYRQATKLLRKLN